MMVYIIVLKALRLAWVAHTHEQLLSTPVTLLRLQARPVGHLRTMTIERSAVWEALYSKHDSLFADKVANWDSHPVVDSPLIDPCTLDHSMQH